MVPRLVPEISSLDAFCDGAAAAGGGGGAGIGDSGSLIIEVKIVLVYTKMKLTNIRYVGLDGNEGGLCAMWPPMDHLLSLCS